MILFFPHRFAFIHWSVRVPSLISALAQHLPKRSSSKSYNTNSLLRGNILSHFILVFSISSEQSHCVWGYFVGRTLAHICHCQL